MSSSSAPGKRPQARKRLPVGVEIEIAELMLKKAVEKKKEDLTRV